MMAHNHRCHQRSATNVKPGRKLISVGSIFLAVFLLSFLPYFAPLNQSLLSYLEVVWWAVLLGLFIGGLIEYFVPEGFILRYLGQRRRISLLYAVIGGFVMSACSHGILAIAMQLYKKGASIPSVITFLMAAPWANLPVTILMFGFFGTQALVLILAAMGIAVLTGLIYMVLEKWKFIEQSRSAPAHEVYEWTNVKQFVWKDAVSGVWRGMVHLANMVLWWILLGILIAAVIGAYVPSSVFMQYLGPTVLGVLATLLFATIIEVCSEGSAPIAFEIYKNIGVLGNPFVFLMAGVATDYTEIGLLWSTIGKRTALWLPVVTVPLIVVVALMLNAWL